MTNEFMVDKQETLNYINDLTQVIRDKYNPETKLKLKKIYKGVGGVLSDETCAYTTIVKTKENQFTVFLSDSVRSFENDKKMMKRQKKILAISALGYTLLFLGFRTNPDVWEKFPVGHEEPIIKSGFLDNRERMLMAFQFALMLPKNQFVNALIKHSDDKHTDVEAMAKDLKVRWIDIIHRGRDLGYIGW